MLHLMLESHGIAADVALWVDVGVGLAGMTLRDMERKDLEMKPEVRGC